MSRPRNTLPKLCETRDGRAFTKVDGVYYSLGRAGSSDAQKRYAEILARHADGTLKKIASKTSKAEAPSDGLAVAELLVQYVSRELSRFSAAEQRCQLSAMKILRQKFGLRPVTDFGPLKFRVVQDAMVNAGWSRSFINRQMKRLRSIFKWGVSWELVPQTLMDSLRTVSSLKPGTSDAPESKPRRAIPEADLQAVRALLCERHRDLVDLMLLTGCRPGELLGLTTGMIDRSADIWRADLVCHKTAHKGKARTLFFNKTAQAILRKYLKVDSAARVFPLRGDTFSNAIKSACEVAYGMPAHLRKPGRQLTPQQRAEAKAWRRQHVWTPHWLRHTVATRLADEVGTEAAQRLLGHSTTAMTLHYSRTAEKQAIEAAKRLG